MGQTHDGDCSLEAGVVAVPNPAFVIQLTKASRILQGEALRTQHASTSDTIPCEVDCYPQAVWPDKVSSTPHTQPVLTVSQSLA